MEFAPLSTYSGCPHLSNEQRTHFQRLKIENMNTVSPLFDNENYNALFGQFSNFQKWRVIDLCEPMIHPIHLLHLTIQHRLEYLRDASEELERKKATGEITSEEYADRKSELNYHNLEAWSNVDLGIKRELRKLKKNVRMHTNVPTNERAAEG